MEPAFSFTVSYDAESVVTAARTLFLQLWRRTLMVFTALGVIVGIGGMLYLNTIPELSFFKWWLLLPLVLLPLSFGHLYWLMSRRLIRSLTGTAHIILTDADFSMSSERGSSVVPWKTFKFARRDAKNILLFASNGAAAVVPTTGMPEAAVEFALAHVESANKS